MKTVSDPKPEITNRRRLIISMLSEITCGEACWHAKEELCKCSCGGKNHGCLLGAGGERPVRTARMGRHIYELAAIGTFEQIRQDAIKINEAHYPASVDPMKDASGKVIQRYHYSYSESQDGSPARVKGATAPQIGAWKELASWLEQTARPYLLWRRVDAPAPTYCPDDGCQKCNALKAARP